MRLKHPSWDTFRIANVSPRYLLLHTWPTWILPVSNRCPVKYSHSVHLIVPETSMRSSIVHTWFSIAKTNNPTYAKQTTINADNLQLSVCTYTGIAYHACLLKKCTSRVDQCKTTFHSMIAVLFLHEHTSWEQASVFTWTIRTAMMADVYTPPKKFIRGIRTNEKMQRQTNWHHIVFRQPCL